MIRFSLRCENGHEFDGWFASGEAFDKLRSAGLTDCAICGSSAVEKAVMAPRVRPARGASADNAATKTPCGERPLSTPASATERALAELRRKIETTSEYVGDDFAAEARRIHDGDAPERSIFGEARAEDTRGLIDDGIPVAPLPWSTGRKVN